MTIAATNFMAVLTGTAPAPAVSATPTADFSAAIGTALASEMATGPAIRPPVAAAAPANSAAPALALVAGVAGVAGEAVRLAPCRETASAEATVAGLAGPVKPQAAQEALAHAARPPELPTGCAVLETPVELLEALSPSELAEPEAERSSEEATDDAVISPEPAPPEVGSPETKPVVLVMPPDRPAQPATVLAAEQPGSEGTAAGAAAPAASRSGGTVDAEPVHRPAATQGPLSFADHATAAASTPAPGVEGAMPASIPASPAASERSVAMSAEPAPQPARDQATVNARPGQIGREMGVEIARHLSAGGEELTVRLNPAEMGRIEVRLSFDDRGTLRAVVAAESAAALEMLRRDHADLGLA